MTVSLCSGGVVLSSVRGKKRRKKGFLGHIGAFLGSGWFFFHNFLLKTVAFYYCSGIILLTL